MRWLQKLPAGIRAVLMASTATLVLATYLVWYYNRGNSSSAGSPGARATTSGGAAYSGAPLGDVSSLDAEVRRAVAVGTAANSSIGSTVDDAGRQDDPLDRIIIVLEFRGHLRLSSSEAFAPVSWVDSRFELSAVSPYTMWIALNTVAIVSDSGEFKLRTECRRMPEIATSDDVRVIEEIMHWSHASIRVTHPQLVEKDVMAPLSPWPKGLVAGKELSREIEVGEVQLSHASGVRGTITTPDYKPVGGAIVALYTLNSSGETESSIQAVSVIADPRGSFYLHYDAGARGVIIATADGYAPDWRRVEFSERVVSDVGRLELSFGFSIAGRVLRQDGDGESPSSGYVVVDDVDPSLLDSTTNTWHKFHLSPIGELYCWDESSVFRLRSRSPVAADGAFEIGGLSSRCYRLRFQAPRIGERDLDRRQLLRSSKIWSVACAPQSTILVEQSTAVMTLRFLGAEGGLALEDRMAGAIGWTDDNGEDASIDYGNLNELCLEVMPLQPIEVRLKDSPTGRVHRLITPGPGEAAIYELEQ